MRVRMRHGIIGEDGRDWLPGSEHDAAPRFAHYLVSHGFAELADDGAVLPPAPPLTSEAVITARDPFTVSRDPQVSPAPRGRRK